MWCAASLKMIHKINIVLKDQVQKRWSSVFNMFCKCLATIHQWVQRCAVGLAAAYRMKPSILFVSIIVLQKKNRNQESTFCQNPQTILKNPAITSGETNEGLQPVVEQHTICTLGLDALQIQTCFCETTQEIASIGLIT